MQVATTAMASAVLPTPPGPVSVVTGADAMLSVTLRSSVSRPINRRGRNTGGRAFGAFAGPASRLLTRRLSPIGRRHGKRRLTPVDRLRADKNDRFQKLREADTEIDSAYLDTAGDVLELAKDARSLLATYVQRTIGVAQGSRSGVQSAEAKRTEVQRSSSSGLPENLEHVRVAGWTTPQSSGGQARAPPDTTDTRVAVRINALDDDLVHPVVPEVVEIGEIRDLRREPRRRGVRPRSWSTEKSSSSTPAMPKRISPTWKSCRCEFCHPKAVCRTS